MSENPYEPPQPTEPAALPRQRVALSRVLLLAGGLLIAPVCMVGTYLAIVVLLTRLYAAIEVSGPLAVVASVVMLGLPVLPAFFVAKAFSAWLRAPEWWETSVMALSVALALAILVVLVI